MRDCFLFSTPPKIDSVCDYSILAIEQKRHTSSWFILFYSHDIGSQQECSR